MKLAISPISQVPIYEQIKNQIKEEILNGTLAAGTQLPSIRALARELKVGVITVKRAYDDLCEEEILISRAGVGIFAAEFDAQKLKGIYRGLLTEQLMDIKRYAQSIGVGKSELIELLKEID